MPFDVNIDRVNRLVSGVCHGRIEEPDWVDHIAGVPGDSSVSSYDEFVVFRGVTAFDLGAEAIQRLTR